MAKHDQAHKARGRGRTVGSNPYVRRLIEDEELRDNIRDAYEAGRAPTAGCRSSKAPRRR